MSGSKFEFKNSAQSNGALSLVETKMKYLNDKRARNDWRRIFWLKDNKINRIRIFSHNYEKSIVQWFGPSVGPWEVNSDGLTVRFDGLMSHKSTIYELKLYSDHSHMD